MRCVNPFVKNGEAYSCGNCLPCRKTRARVWYSRIMLEASQHEHSTVVTLTFDRCSLPETGDVSVDTLQHWLKRIRASSLERYSWRRLRFIGCGEYGEKTWRPHYHVILFGYVGCSYGRTGRQWCEDCGCDSCQDISRSWSLGATSQDALTKQSAAYVAGYVTRKLASSSDGKRRAPFMRMSLQPGIGASAMDDVASTVIQWNLAVPLSLGGPTGRLPLGRYLRKKLAEKSDAPVPIYQESDAMRAVREAAFAHGTSQARLFAEINSVYESRLLQRYANQEKVL